ncbi:hypothetical protein BS47DRAFT_1339750, partial [Hydnum rufescens UP504]
MPRLKDSARPLENRDERKGSQMTVINIHKVRCDAVKLPRGKMNCLRISTTPSPLSSCLGIALAFDIDR